MQNSLELKDSVAIVTGSVRGIGRAVALAFARAGAAVVINARTSETEAKAVAAEVEAAGGRALVYLADVTAPDEVDAMVAATVKAFGRLDILVNNVAMRLAQPVTETSYEEWSAVLGSTKGLRTRTTGALRGETKIRHTYGVLLVFVVTQTSRYRRSCDTCGHRRDMS